MRTARGAARAEGALCAFWPLRIDVATLRIRAQIVPDGQSCLDDLHAMDDEPVPPGEALARVLSAVGKQRALPQSLDDGVRHRMWTRTRLWRACR
ncbi:hypothetical protein [Streptomyces sp. NBC_00690]|uniref:hypothetical protein n=1 Tax=Streptomyces sp. NBC_00690 TaxID=2975808 RepID=UPI002E2B6F76|nr:hypothetical protein [Streptomyces sp. NBC_00690]